MCSSDLVALGNYNYIFNLSGTGDYRVHDAGSDVLIVKNTGNVGIGTTAPARLLDVSGTAQMTGFKMPTGAASGYVLTSDASGVGSWSDLSSTAGPWTLSGSSLYPDSTGYNVGIGTTSATSPLTVSGAGEFSGALTAATIDTGNGAFEIQNASTADKGLASFSSSNFAVTSGAVSIVTGGVGAT